jgi:hypothetical protein
VKKRVRHLAYRFKKAILIIGLPLIALISLPAFDVISSAQAQQTSQTNKVSKKPQVKQKASVPSSKQSGIKFKDNSLNNSSKSLSLNPELFKKIEGEHTYEGGANLDYRVQRGCQAAALCIGFPPDLCVPTHACGAARPQGAA